MEDILALALNSIPLLSTPDRIILSKFCDNISSFRSFKSKDLLNISAIKKTPKRSTVFQEIDFVKIWDSSEKLYSILEKRDIRIIHLFKSDYPPLLRKIHDPPFLMFYRGCLPNPVKPCLGIVGTRKPSQTSKNETAIFVREVAPYLGSIVSGLALGIDTAAHRASIDIQSHTTAIMGSGFDHIYPPTNKRLLSDIINKGGAVLTEYSPDTQPKSYNFPVRNRIIAGISRGLLVIEAPNRSGALITADSANQEGRDVYVHQVGLQYLEGTYRLAEEGATVLQRGSDLLNLWGIDIQVPPPQKSSPELLPQVQEHHETNSDLYKNKIYSQSQQDQVSLSHKNIYSQALRRLIIEDTAKDIGLSNNSDDE